MTREELIEAILEGRRYDLRRGVTARVKSLIKSKHPTMMKVVRTPKFQKRFQTPGAKLLAFKHMSTNHPIERRVISNLAARRKERAAGKRWTSSSAFARPRTYPRELVQAKRHHDRLVKWATSKGAEVIPWATDVGPELIAARGHAVAAVKRSRQERKPIRVSTGLPGSRRKKFYNAR